MADAYLQSLLADGETIRSEARQHPMALIRFAFQPILVFLGALLLLAIGSWLTPDGQGLFSDIVRWIDTLLGLVTAGMFILAVLWFPIQVFRWTKRRYMVTDRRVLYVDGVLRKNSVDAGLSMITDVGFRQSMLGRSLGYGDLMIATASNRPLNFREIRDALAFKQAIMAAQHATVEARADEILVSKGLAPTAASAPVVAAAAVSAAPVAAVPPAAEAAAVPAEPASPAIPAWDGSDVPQMHEDDAPPSDPMIFGTPGEPAEEEPPAAEPAEAVGETSEPVAAAIADERADVPEMIEDDTPDLDPMVTGGPVGATQEAAAGAADLTEEAPEAVEEAPEAVEETVEAAAIEVPEAVEEAPEAVEETVEAAAVEVPEAVAEAPEATPVATSEVVEETAQAAGAGGHVAALQDVDATIGGLTDSASGSGADSVTSAIARLAELRDSGAITAEEFESRKQDLLDRL